MNLKLKESTFTYYNERAPEYEEIYTQGKGPASISDPGAYQAEVRIFLEIVNKVLKGRVIDIGCGTGFWIPYYYRNCAEIYLFDQSLNMLSSCREKVNSLGIREKCSFLNGDFWNYQFNKSYFDSALAGFFFSHITDYNECHFFKILKNILKNQAVFLILDSVWNKDRAGNRNKQGRQKRVLNNGSQFDIYKRYFTSSDFKAMKKKYNIHLEVLHSGKVFIVVKGCF